MILSQETNKTHTHTHTCTYAQRPRKIQVEEWKECDANNHHNYLTQLYQYEAQQTLKSKQNIKND